MKQWIGIGDIHNNVSQMEHIPEFIHADGIIIHGDITNMGDYNTAASMISQISQKNAHIFAQAGNMDSLDIQAYLDKKTHTIHCKGIEICPGVGLMGVGLSSPTPFQTPGEVPDAQLGEWLEETWKHIQNMPHTIVVTHDPPFGTKLDTISGGGHVGSQAVLAFIEKHQPDILLCGHIHEARGTDTIGQTKAVNPGLFAEGGYALIQYDQGALDIVFKTINQ
ncbi:MAG: metallophosphoesterase [Candidatus Magnetomorum sp.]|nr:metallophosphoesterase [Candidatus Magnetomorum sp.]